ncbi:MAG: ketoacyl-ACP synthase III [Alistipes senegalensis]|nr:ketoacyl-ACP synthase III [Oxalobacter formigenes]MCM1281284.1 ketoacyl-ACP synthase III [Alistipes senegalensis]
MTVYAKIIGTGSYLPPRRVPNEELVDMLAKKGVETSDEWIRSRSGIAARHFADPGVYSSDLGVEAAKKALEMAQVDPGDVDMVIVATATPDFLGGFPNTASVIQKKLGIQNGCAAMDVQAVCSGFIYALTVADSFIRSGVYRKVLVIGAEVYSRILNFQDRTTCVLFGDGAGAVLVSASDEPGILGTRLHADGSYGDVLCITGKLGNGAVDGQAFLYMDGTAVYKLAVTLMDKVGLEVLEMTGTPTSEVDWLIPHQANIRIMHSSARKMGIPGDHVVETVDRHGNTSAASIPLALDTAVRDGRVRPGQKVLMVALGGGLTWGAVLAKM